MKIFCAFILLIIAGCSGTQKPVVTIQLTGQSIKITGIDPLILNDIARDSSADWQSLFPVYLMPDDSDMKDYQEEQPGKYQVQNGAVLFTPDTPFTKTKTYFVRCYDHSSGKDAWNYISGQGKRGAPHYIDLIFRAQ